MSFDQTVLAAVARLEPDAYGVTIRREVSARTGWDASIVGIYMALARLAAQGLVSSREGEATPERGGRPKRYFDTVKGE